MKREEEEALKGFLLNRKPPAFEGFDERSRRLYRRLVRGALSRGVKGSLPRTVEYLGEEALEDWIRRWMEDSPPKSRLYWRLPLLFAEWIRNQEATPAWLGDLVHWEAVQLDVRNASDWAEGGEEQPLEEQPDRKARVALDPSTRLGIYEYPVYRWKGGGNPTKGGGGPYFVVIYRRDERPWWRVVEGKVAQLLALVAEGSPLEEGLKGLETMYGAIEAEPLMEELRLLRERGAIRGFLRDSMAIGEDSG